MSSILTNNGAMVALQTLQGINASMAKTQNEISTGKTVATAKDNASIWAISKTMESDVAGFKAIGDSLALGRSTVAVARNATESVANLLKDIKTKIVAGTKADISTSEREKLQTDIDALKAQIGTVVSSAQFNGQNLINGASSNPVAVLSSVDRSISGVNASYIDVSTFDLRSEAVSSYTEVIGSLADGSTTATNVALGTPDFSDAAGATGGTEAVAASSDTYKSAGVVAGDTFTLRLNDKQFSYTIKVGDTSAEIATGLNAAITKAGLTGVAVTDTAGALAVENNSATAFDVQANVTRGAMGTLSAFDVMSEDKAKAFLDGIETLIQNSINTAANFGSAERRIEIQADFVSKLTDSLNSGIGAMVDANMEEVSARLQALQVQQQLGVQSLSIANQAPQMLLSLFR